MLPEPHQPIQPCGPPVPDRDSWVAAHTRPTGDAVLTGADQLQSSQSRFSSHAIAVSMVSEALGLIT